MSVSSLISLILETFVQILIGRMLDPPGMAHYTVPMNLLIRAQVVASALARTVFSSMCRQDAADGQRLTTNAIVWLVYVFGAICGPAIIILGPFLQAWIEAGFAQNSKVVGQILMFGAWANGIAILHLIMLLAQGKANITACVRAVEVVPFVGGLWLLATHLGLPGGAIACIIYVSAERVLLMWLSGCLARSIKRSLPGLALMVMCFVVSQIPRLGWASSFAIGTAVGAAFLGIFPVVEPTLRDTFRTAGEVLARIRWSAVTI